MPEFMSRVEHRFRFSSKELLRLIITVLAAAFAITIFKGWGFFDITKGDSIIAYMTNFVIVSNLLAAAFLVHFSAQKLAALRLGYSSEYKHWKNGIFLSLVLSFLSFGFVPFFFPGVLWLDDIPKLRIGVFRGGVKHADLGVIATAGPLANMILVGILAPFYIFSGSAILYGLIVANLLTAVFSLLPIPTFEKVRSFRGGTSGLYIFIASRWVFVLIFVTVLIFSLLILVAQIFSFIIAAIIGIMAAFIYYRTYESSKR